MTDKNNRREKAKERQGERTDIKDKCPEGEKGEARDKAAEKINRREKKEFNSNINIVTDLIRLMEIKKIRAQGKLKVVTIPLKSELHIGDYVLIQKIKNPEEVLTTQQNGSSN